MHKNYIILLLILVTNTSITSPSATAQHNTQDSLKNHYITIQKKLFNNNYIEAIEDLTKIHNLYPIEPCAQQIQIYLIYAYYKANNLKAANDSIQLFLNVYPNYKHLDYIWYIHGLVNMSLDKRNTLSIIKYLNMHEDNYNPHYAINAFHSFSKLIQHYPNSQYCNDSYKRLIILKNRIAEHELSIIKFYYHIHAYISVIVRSEKMLRSFSDTQSARHTLYYIHQAYQKLHLSNQSNIISKIIAENTVIY